MLKRGIEPQTFALLARRSNQLSYSSLIDFQTSSIRKNGLDAAILITVKTIEIKRIEETDTKEIDSLVHQTIHCCFLFSGHLLIIQ